MDKITLDREAFKALASDTRLEILKALDDRRKTVTELARELALNKATVFEHLEKLATVELVRKIEDDRKWVYYDLSWKGRRILHPEKITIALLLSSSIASLVTAAGAFWAYFTASTSGAGANGGAQESSPGIMETPADAARDAGLAQDPAVLGVAIALLLLCATLAVVAGFVWKHYKKNPHVPSLA